jgi:ubiquinone/menaquinone biosynthesis C-methylase UbiE
MDIPDFRVFPDPWIDFEDDRQKARVLYDEFSEKSFEDLVRYYWRITPDTPPELAERYVRHVLGGVDRGRSSINEIFSLTRGKRGDAFLEFGCGTGGFLVAARKKFGTVAGVDIAFRWLILAKKRLEEAGVSGVQLVCCCGEYLPYPNKSFDLVVASDVIEHTDDQVGMVKQGLDALKPNGRLFLATPNRLSLSPEPHVQVWGVGWLPRRWMPAYVKKVRGIEYKNIRTVSYFELKSILKIAGARNVRIFSPRIPKEELGRYSDLERLLIGVYHFVVGQPLLRWPLYVFGPLFHAVCRPGR